MNDWVAYVLMYGNDNYVSANSISWDTRSRMFILSYSKFLTNGYNTYPTEQAANKDMQKLQNLAYELGLKFKQTVRVEKVDMLKRIDEESKLDIPQYPFKHIILDSIELASA